MSEYASVATFYDRIQRHLTDYRQQATEMDEMFRPRGVKSVLDIACGTGSHILELAALGYQCTGADLSPEMLQVARAKAAERQLEAEFRVGDMRSCAFDRKFDAVIGLYALTTLVRDEDLMAVFTNVCRALRDDGLFYFNMLNADVNVPSDHDPPCLFIDVAVSEPGLRLVRLNQTSWSDGVQNWLALYLFDLGDGARLAVGDHQLRSRHLDQIRRDLQLAGYRIEKVGYSDVQGLKDWDMRILASNAGYFT